MACVLSVSDIRKRFGGVVALRGVSLQVHEAEIVGLVGANGAGKSTLIKILSGIFRPDGGQVVIRGRQVDIASPLIARQLGLATVHQEIVLAPDLTVGETLWVGREPTRWLGRLNHRAMYAEAERFLESLGFSEISPFDVVGRLSVSQRQLVQIAKALAEQAELLIFDEPTSSLTGTEVERLLRIVRSLKNRGLSVIFVSHRLDEVMRVADRVVVLRDGAVAGTCRPSEEGALDAIVKLMVGRPVDEFYPRRRGSPSAEVTLSVEGLQVRQEGPGVSFYLRKGEILGFYGSVGSGRTEVAEALFGLRHSYGGNLVIDGKRVGVPSSPGAALRLGIGLVPEDRRRQGLILIAPLVHNVSLVALNRYTVAGVVRRRRESEAVTKLLHKVNAKFAHVGQPVESLSGGNQQKALLAKWLQLPLRVLILDEATKGIDVNAKVEIYKLINDLADSGVAIIFVSTDAEECYKLCDRVLVFREGNVVAAVSPSEIEIADLVRLGMVS